MSLDFSDRDLKSRSFRGQDLKGANFSNADIRGTDFAKANLLRANFTDARAGLRPYQVLAIVIFSVFLSALSSFAGGTYAGLIGAGISITSPLDALGNAAPLFAVGSIITLVASIIIFFFKNFKFVFIYFLIQIAILTMISGLFLKLGSMGFAGASNTSKVISWINNGGILSMLLANTALAAMTLAVVLSVMVAGLWGIVGCLAGASSLGLWYALDEYWITVWVISGVMATSLAGVYLAKQVLAGNYKLSFFRTIAITLMTIRGTSFRSTNLTEANFTHAVLKGADFSDSQLVRTNFHRARKLDQARVSSTILSDPVVCNLLTTHRGSHQSFRGRKLNGANLTNADLCGADLCDTNINEATFAAADLVGANLSSAQALKTNFKQAQMTSACIEAWNIDNDTQLEGVVCDYVYLLNHQQERRPSSGSFAPGEFTKLFQEVLDTVDLIFRNGLDYTAFLTAFKQVQVKNQDTELAIRSIENKGDGVIVVKVDVPAHADKPKIHSELTQDYALTLKAIEEQYQATLQAKDEQLTIYRQHQADLKELTQLLINRPTRHLEASSSVAAQTPEGKLVVLKLGPGDFDMGYPVILQIGVDGTLPAVEMTGQLPASPELPKLYRQWQVLYRKSLKAVRLDVPQTQVTNISRQAFFQDCYDSAERLSRTLNDWLNSDTFRPVREQLLGKLDVSEPIRVILQTDQYQLRQLPWQLWDWFENYPKVEMALSANAYGQVKRSKPTSSKNARILAVLGNSANIDIRNDRKLIEELSNVTTTFMVEPHLKALNHQLWMHSWDILFFAGHSASQHDHEMGQLYINSTDTITIPQLKYALRKAIEQGLRLAIFNSCDGLGLATNLADLSIPQMIVMREPVPDQVAQEFLKNFLQVFSSGKSFYQSVREAREMLQGLEDQFPFATWLPVIFQNPAEIPPTWQEFL